MLLLHISAACDADEFQCNNSQCVPLSAKCNDNADCLDWSDEVNCNKCMSYCHSLFYF
uniref:Uncharacterized protein n=1 Tax=Branchiostoma floridae TaxID=7739 RepID=C3Y8S0_BRAFL|eukprot:XP_002606966.1 hypothetical protein BRAFLDRAFT_200587 [Branchiostoma floridae]